MFVFEKSEQCNKKRELSSFRESFNRTLSEQDNKFFKFSGNSFSAVKSVAFGCCVSALLCSGKRYLRVFCRRQRVLSYPCDKKYQILRNLQGNYQS